MAAEIEIAAMSDPFQFAEFAGGQEGKGVFNVGRAGRIMAQFVRIVFAQPQSLAGQAQCRCTIACADRANTGTTVSIHSGWQKNSISICSNSRERKVKLRGVISLRKLLPICAIPKGTRTRVLSTTFLKLTKMP